MYSSNRKSIIYGVFGVLVFLFILDITNALMGEVSLVHFWGLLLGALWGIATCLFIPEKWDPIHLRSKSGNHSSTNARWQWSIPLGVLAANILLDFVDSFIADVLAGIIGGWLYITLGYLAFLAWRHSQK